jgi:hypothetical protein
MKHFAVQKKNTYYTYFEILLQYKKILAKGRRPGQLSRSSPRAVAAERQAVAAEQRAMEAERQAA